MPREKSWQDLLPVSQIIPGDATPVEFGSLELAVYDTVDGITVSMARCTHGAANLCDGYFNGRHIECPLHQGLFDARSGKALAAPARTGLRMLDARVRDGMIQVFLASKVSAERLSSTAKTISAGSTKSG